MSKEIDLEAPDTWTNDDLIYMRDRGILPPNFDRKGVPRDGLDPDNDFSETPALGSVGTASTGPTFDSSVVDEDDEILEGDEEDETQRNLAEDGLYDEMTHDGLQEELRRRMAAGEDVKIGGTKKELVARLRENDDSESQE